MEKEIRMLLFKLINCQGIGNIGCLKILKFVLENETVRLTQQELLKIAEIKKYQSLFLNSWENIHKMGERFTLFAEAHQFLMISDTAYPPLLREIYNAPVLLFFKGDIRLLNDPSISFVGSRAATPYGLKVVREFIPGLVEAGYVIVSGMAKGIDRKSHEAAIASGGKTIGVIGTGLDQAYPKETEGLHRLMADTQLLISEYPNGTPPKRHHFPSRNRIIAGISKGTCLVEASRKSGSLITAQAALEYGRDVFVVPGNIFLPHSEGCHTLLYEGANCVFSPQDILNEISFFC